jgi:hypothetical protein
MNGEMKKKENLITHQTLEPHNIRSRLMRQLSNTSMHSESLFHSVAGTFYLKRLSHTKEHIQLYTGLGCTDDHTASSCVI